MQERYRVELHLLPNFSNLTLDPILQQPVRPLDVSVEQQNMLPLDLSVQLQSLLSLDVSVLQQTLLLGCVNSIAGCAALSSSSLTASARLCSQQYTRLCCLWTCVCQPRAHAASGQNCSNAAWAA